jgi:hypothetical protein
MGYTKIGWQNSPNASTPLTAENLDKMDSGIKKNSDDIEEANNEFSKFKTDEFATATTDISNMKEDNTTNKKDISGLKTDVSGAKSSINDLKNNIDKINPKIKSLENIVEQLKKEVKQNVQDGVLQKVYPVGSFYISESTVSPATLFGFGRWEKIEDKFLIGASRNTPIKSSGGSKTHSHGNKNGRNGNLAAAIGAVNGNVNAIGYKAANDTDISVLGNATFVVSGAGQGFAGWNHFTAVVGQTAEDGTLPPYYAVNIWRRTE